MMTAPNLKQLTRFPIAIVLALLLGAVLAACHRSGGEAPALVDPNAHAMFLRHVIDQNPPGGADCCTDVLAVGDINGNGYVDIVIGSQNDKNAGLVWYEYPTWRKHEIAKGNFTTDGKAVDFDVDGDADIVVGDSDRGLMWFEQMAPDRWAAHILGAGYVHDLVVADFDGDGIPDVVTTDKKAVRLFSRKRDGTVRQSEILKRPGEGLQAVDLDGDGDIDLVYSDVWIENHTGVEGSSWTVHDVDPMFDPSTRIQVADINGDGRSDLVLSGSEGRATLVWYERTGDGKSLHWIKHGISEKEFEGAHSLQVTDFDLDGRPDVLVAEMNTSKAKRIVIYLQRSPDVWTEMPLAQHGSHNMIAADLDQDGDVDIVGKNYQGQGRFVEFWENRSADLALVPKSDSKTTWMYEPIDTSRPQTDHHAFGLLSADVNGNRLSDIIAGGTVYLRPRTDSGPWRRIEVAPGADIIHVLPQRRNGWPTFLGFAGAWLCFISSTDEEGSRWTTQRLKSLPEGRSQGHAKGKTGPNGQYDFYFTRGTTLFRLIVYSNAPGTWPLVRIRNDVQEEGVAVGDLDGDGDEDVVVVEADGRKLMWLETMERAPRRTHFVGASVQLIDRVAVADVNGDGRNDIIFTEETRDDDYDARLVWLEAPRDPRSEPWRPHVVTVLRSINSLGIADVDGNGAVDLIAAEHTDLRPNSLVTKNFTGIFLNRGDGTFVTEVVENGPHSSHLGALPIGRDSTGRFEIASIGWEQTCCVHRWVQTTASPSGTNAN